MFILGIDPGKSGGIGLVNTAGHHYLTFKFSTEKDIAELIKDYAHNGMILKAYLEKVHAMPKQGVSSTFTFGANYGFYRGVLQSLDIPFEEVSPNLWQKTLKCQTKGNKNVTKIKAQELFPKEKITHAVADALLIAEYGRRLMKGEF